MTRLRITVTAGDAITVDKNTTLTVLKPTNDTAKTASVALTAYNFYLILHVFVFLILTAFVFR